MKRQLLHLLTASALFGGGIPEMKLTARDKRTANDRRPNNPPRSMTEREKELYAIKPDLQYWVNKGEI
jgi:hypothetical protein